MSEIHNEFQKIYVNVWNTKLGKRFFDPLRKIFLPITPEELVRQRTIIYLHEECKVPLYCMHSEEHLSHYGINKNGRMDIVITSFSGDYELLLAVVECKKESVLIESEQVIEQAYNYASLTNAKYFILVNGVRIKCYKMEGDKAVSLSNTLTYSDMIIDNIVIDENVNSFERLDYDKYFDINALSKEPWIESKIGEDTSKVLIPHIINLDDCFLDTNYQLDHIKCNNFELVEDLGTQLRQYNDASGGGFGTGTYRSFIIKDNRNDQNFLIGFSIIATGKTVNDPKYGNTDGKSVLVIIVNDGDTDEMSVQINMNQYLSVAVDNKVRLTHNGAVKRRGAKKEDLFAYIEHYTDNLVANGRIDFGELDCSKSLTMASNDVIAFVSRLIEYAVYRNEYKKGLSRKND